MLAADTFHGDITVVVIILGYIWLSSRYNKSKTSNAVTSGEATQILQSLLIGYIDFKISKRQDADHYTHYRQVACEVSLDEIWHSNT